jgi:hypothetical protein
MAAGLALESALVSKMEAAPLAALYDKPDLARAIQLHDELLVSLDHREREAAIWLETGLDLGPLRHDPRGLAEEMREMEVVLGTLLNRSGEALREVNDWINLIANASQFILDGYWIDAKIFLSRALRHSQSPSVEALRAQHQLSHEVGVLQRATESYFEELKGYPLKLQVDGVKLQRLLLVQEVMLELMRMARGPEEVKPTGKAVYRLSQAIRYLMGEGRQEDVGKELRLASEYLRELIEASEKVSRHTEIQGYVEQVEEILQGLQL